MKNHLFARCPVSCLYALGLAMVTLCVYFPAIMAGYIWDDDTHITQNPDLQSWEGLERIWTSPRSAHVKQYYPLTYTVFWLEYQIWGVEPMGYHSVNVFLHICNALLVWRILNLLKIRGAVLAASVFALHPVHVETVAWISEGKNTFSTFFYFISFLFFFRFEQTGKRGEYLLSWFSYLLAMLCKTVACSLPVALWIFFWWKNGALKWRDMIKTLPFFAVGIPLGLLTAGLESALVGASGEYWNLTFWQRFLIASHAWWFYPYKLVWPLDLVFIYPRWQIDIFHLPTWMAPLLAMIFMATLWTQQKKIGRGPFASLAFFSVTIFPALSFFDLYPMRYSFVADHFQYLASLGPIVLFSSTIFSWGERISRYKWWRALSLSIFPLILGMLSYRQTFMYEDAKRLWLCTLAKNDRAMIAYNNLGLIYLEEGNLEEAKKIYARALSIDPAYGDIHYNLGVVYEREGNVEKAIEQYRKAILINPSDAQAQNNLGRLYQEKKDFSQALFHYERSLSSFFSPPVLYNLGALYLEMKAFEKAIEQYRKIVARFPEEKRVHALLAKAYYANREYRLAIYHCDLALASHVPMDPVFLKSLQSYRISLKH